MNFSSELLGNRRWLRRDTPFPHVVARSVFSDQFYPALDADMRSLIARGLSETADPDRLARNIPGYDAYAMGFRPDSSLGTLNLFLSPSWRNLVNGLFGAQPTPYIFVGAHYHEPGSRFGFIHNDYNPVWFPRARDDLVCIPAQEGCNYKTGAGSLPATKKAKVVRAVALIFFLANDGWRSGDGGETGLYRSHEGPVSEPAISIPPENNSLVAFECSPSSFHAFMTNTRRPRASIIMWTHRPMAAAASRFGLERLEHWR